MGRRFPAASLTIVLRALRKVLRRDGHGFGLEFGVEALILGENGKFAVGKAGNGPSPGGEAEGGPGA